MDQRTLQNRKVFFSEQNERMLYGLLSKSFSQRVGGPLNEKQQARLERTVEHYMSEVFQAKSNYPAGELNKEVLSAAASDYAMYLQRQTIAENSSPDMYQEPAQRFEQLQMERQRSLEAPRPPVPEYVKGVVLKEDDEISAMELFEEAKKRRNMEASIQAQAELNKRNNAAPIFQVEDRPDPKELFSRPLDMVVAAQREPPGRADINPTIARPGPEALRGTLQQDIIIKQEDIQNYKETEYNLSIYSADRKWELDNGENRYNFSVNLYSGNPTNGMSIMPKGTARFRNIVRIEFVKAILPIEGLDVNVRRTTTSAYDTAALTTLYSFPFVLLNVDELDNNNYGTNDAQDRAFGLLQYDANWISETSFANASGGATIVGNRGFTGFIPKHMKCQRVYAPTPLASLTKLTVQLQRPDGNVLSTIPDTVDISGIFFSYQANGDYFSTSYGAGSANNSIYYDSAGTTGNYIWLDAYKWFNRFAVTVGDRIVLRGLSSALPLPTRAQKDFIDFLERPEGHLVAQIAFASSTGTSPRVTTITDGPNAVGYARFIIIENQYNDPTSGSTSLLPFGGEASNSTLGTSLLTRSFRPARLLNLSHQVQLIFRVITREYDSTSLVRPDNL